MNGVKIGDPAYWEVRYKQEILDLVQFDLFDWYCPFSQIYHMTHSFFSSGVNKILIVGVGRSDVVEYLYHKGYRDITAIDISESIIIEMRRKYESYAGVEFFVMDVRQLHKFKDNSFTVIIDKACIDALYCGTDYLDSTNLALTEIYRVLKPDGVFFSITHAPPLSRVPYFRLIPWAIDSYKIPSEIGEGLTLFVLIKTNNEQLLSKKIAGAEAVLRPKAKKVVSSFDQNMNKSSTSRSKGNAGSITVTASANILAELVAESAEMDG